MDSIGIGKSVEEPLGREPGLFHASICVCGVLVLFRFRECLPRSDSRRLLDGSLPLSMRHSLRIAVYTRVNGSRLVNWL